MAKPLIIPNDKRAKPLNVGGFLITILASESDTDGYEIFIKQEPKVKARGLITTHGTNRFILPKDKFIVVLIMKKLSPIQAH